MGDKDIFYIHSVFVLRNKRIRKWDN